MTERRHKNDDRDKIGKTTTERRQEERQKREN